MGGINICDLGKNLSYIWIYLQVWFQGKASCLGLKAGLNEPSNASESSAANPWCELPLPKGPSIVRCSTGHEGQHAVLIDENGTAYFVGLARRGEDGDFCKCFFFVIIQLVWVFNTTFKLLMISEKFIII